METELALLRETIEFLPEAVAIFDSQDRFIHWNRKYAEFYAWGAHLLVRGRSFEDYLRELLELKQSPGADGREEEWLATRMARHRLPFSCHEHEIAGGRWVRVEERRLESGGTIGIRIDITELKQRELRLAYLAQHDELTGLGNRTLLRERIDEATTLARPDRPSSVVCLDLDRFKDVNDALGHPVGDHVLVQVADRLRLQLGPNDTAARLGGDEFAIVFAEVGRPQDAEAAVARIIGVLSEPYQVGHQRIVIGVSAGLALMPLHGRDPETLLQHADIALYRAKANGRGICRTFEPAMNLQIQIRRVLEHELRKAIGTEAIEVHYQPVVHLETGRAHSVEALVRWRHPERGLVSPNVFVGIAEETGLIDQLGVQVLRGACSAMNDLRHLGKVAVNLSPVQFRRTDLVETVVSALEAAKLHPRCLELEITESVLFADTEANLRALHRFKDLGVTIALDDFGTGYSSLSHLRSFPFDRIKIDRSFVGDLMERQDCRAIVRALILMAGDLGIAVTAEGIETEKQRDFLLKQGCQDGQGYLFDPALPLATLMRRWDQTIVPLAGQDGCAVLAEAAR